MALFRQRAEVKLSSWVEASYCFKKRVVVLAQGMSWNFRPPLFSHFFCSAFSALRSGVQLIDLLFGTNVLVSGAQSSK